MRDDEKQPPEPGGSALIREVLLSFWKVHILHHAAEGTVYGQWMMDELRRHGYAISPGTLYPLLRRMESRGWLEPVGAPRVNIHSRREYRLTRLGSEALDRIRAHLRELCREALDLETGGRRGRGPAGDRPAAASRGRVRGRTRG